MSTAYFDPETRQLLFEAIPAPDAAPRWDWDDVLQRARVERRVEEGWPLFVPGPAPRRSTRRVLVTVAACVLAVVLLVPLVAYATGNGWWFQHAPANPKGFSGQLKPVSGVPSVISQGTARGQRWTAVAYVANPSAFQNAQPLVCVSMIVGSIGNAPSGTGCGQLDGRIGQRSGWITYQTNDEIGVVTGAVASGVSRLTAALDAGGTVDVPLRSVSAVGDGVRFFALPYSYAEIGLISAYDSGGTLVERLRLSRPFIPGNHFTVLPRGGPLTTVGHVTGPYGASATIAVGGVVPLSGSPSRCWRVGFSDGESLGTCLPVAAQKDPTWWFQTQHVGRDAFVVVQTEPRTGAQADRVGLELANGRTLTATPVDGIAVFAIPADALSAAKSQRGFLVAYDAKGNKLPFADRGLRFRQAVYYRSCPHGSRCAG